MYTTEKPNSLCCLVVDSGYSFTYITPYVKGKKVKSAIRRIDVGGKLLTNHLKDIISYRYDGVIFLYGFRIDHLKYFVYIFQATACNGRDVCDEPGEGGRVLRVRRLHAGHD